MPHPTGAAPRHLYLVNLRTVQLGDVSRAQEVAYILRMGLERTQASAPSVAVNRNAVECSIEVRARGHADAIRAAMRTLRTLYDALAVEHVEVGEPVDAPPRTALLR